MTWGILGGLLAVAAEALMKQPEFRWWPSLWYMAPAALGINYCIYRLVVDSPSLPAAVVIFASTTLTARIAVSLWAGHPIGAGTWAACALMVIAAALRMWRP